METFANPANAAAAAADVARYNIPVRIYDPAEGESMTYQAGPGFYAGTVSIRREEDPMRLMWDPTEGEFIPVAAY